MERKKSEIRTVSSSAHIPSLDITISRVTVEGFMHGGQKSLWRSSIHLHWLLCSLCVVERISRRGHLVWSSVFYAPIGTWVQK